MNRLQANLKMLLVSTAFLGASASLALAGVPTFQLNPQALNAAYPAEFSAVNFSGQSAELVHLNSGGAGVDSVGASNFSTYGWIDLASIGAPGGGTVLPGTSGLGVNYQLYVIFNLQVTLASGTNGAAGSTYTLNALNFQFWEHAIGTPLTFNDANQAGSGTEATISNRSVSDVLLAEGSAIPGSPLDSVGINSAGGASLNSLDTFLVCSGSGQANLGSTVVPDADCTSGVGFNFFQPEPFFQLAFDEFNNTTGGVAPPNGNLLAINEISGLIDFVPTVPEPGSLALFGSSLLAVGWLSRRRRSKSKTLKE